MLPHTLFRSNRTFTANFKSRILIQCRLLHQAQTNNKIMYQSNQPSNPSLNKLFQRRLPTNKYNSRFRPYQLTTPQSLLRGINSLTASQALARTYLFHTLSAKPRTISWVVTNYGRNSKTLISQRIILPKHNTWAMSTKALVDLYLFKM